MSLKKTLKKIWDALGETHGPYAPAPEVKKKLEEKGYKFEFNSLAIIPYGAAVESYDITSPAGKKVGALFGGKDVTKQYMDDYKQAVEETRPPSPS